MMAQKEILLLRTALRGLLSKANGLTERDVLMTARAILILEREFPTQRGLDNERLPGSDDGKGDLRPED